MMGFMSALRMADIAVKGFVILAIAAIAAYGLRRRSAATVHRMWTLGFAALVVAPAVGLVLPQWGVKVVPEFAADAATRSIVAPSSMGVSLRGEPVAHRESTLQFPAVSEPSAKLQTGGDSVRSNSRSDSQPAKPAVEPAHVKNSSRWPAVISAGWAIVAAGLLARLMLHRAKLALLLRRCEPVKEQDWSNSAAEAARRLRVARPVRLVKHAATATPATAGTWRPTVILPADAGRWSASQRRSVLLHELAHVKRLDVLTQFIAGVACAVHWYNPLSWYGLRQMRKLRELACDDLVLAGGQAPSDYAEALLHVARAYRTLRLAGAVGMTRNSNVERRVLAILDSARNRLPLSRRGATALAIVATTLILGIGSIRLENKPAVADEAPSADAASGSAKPENLSEPRRLEVLIADEFGTPIRGAKVYYSLCYQVGEKHDCPHGAITADDRGRAIVEMPSGISHLKLWASQRGYVPQFIHFPEETINQGRQLPTNYEFRLARGTKLSGRILDEAGRPIAGAKVAVSVDVREPAWGANPDSMISTWLTDSDFNSPAPMSDADGRWSIDNAPAPAGEKDYEFRLRITHDDYFRETRAGEFQREQGITTAMLREGTATIVLKCGVTVEGIVVDAAGNRVTKGWVVWYDEPYFTQGDWESGLDGEGRFRTLPLAAGEHPITVIAPGFAAERRLVNVKPGMDVLKFSLAPGKRVSIRFVDAKGAPVPQAGVYLGASSGPSTWNNSNALHNQTGSGVPDYGIPRRADDEGLYVWEWAPDGTVTYSVGAKGFAPQTLSLVPTSTPHVVTLREQRMATGMATDAETGKPVAKFSAMPVIVFGPDFYHTRTVDAKSGRNGRYELPLTGSADPNDRYRVRFEADGYRSIVSDESFGPLDGKATLNVVLQPAAARQGEVVDADGRPVESAIVIEASPTVVPDFFNGQPDTYDSRPVRTNASGRFELHATAEPVLVRVVHDDGFAEVRLSPDESIGQIHLRPWANIEGRLLQDGRPVPNQTIIFSPTPNGRLGEPRSQDSYQTQTDPEGHFAFDRLPPVVGNVRAYLGPWNESALTSGESAPIDLKPGERRTVDLGGDGAVITGNVSPTGRGSVPLDAHWSLNYLVSRDRGVQLPAHVLKLAFDPSGDKPLEPAWLADPHYNDWLATRAHYFVKLNAAGDLRISGVPAGAYDLVIQLYEQPAGCLVQSVGQRIVPVEVTDDDVASGEKKLDEIEVACRVGPRIGENMQAYKFVDPSGRELSIHDLRGRFVLMHVWASWCAPCLEALPDMKDAINGMSDKQIAFVGLNVDADSQQARELAVRQKWRWGQTYLGDDSDMVRQLAISTVPSYFLIDRDGKLVASSTQWLEIKKMIEDLLEDFPD